jgi:hypothetical protein
METTCVILNQFVYCLFSSAILSISYIYTHSITSGKHPAVRSFGENTFAMEKKEKKNSGRIIIIPVNNTFYSLVNTKPCNSKDYPTFSRPQKTYIYERKALDPKKGSKSIIPFYTEILLPNESKLSVIRSQ